MSLKRLINIQSRRFTLRLANNLSRHTRNSDMRRHIFHNNTTCTNLSILTDFDVPNDRGVSADQHAMSYLRVTIALYFAGTAKRDPVEHGYVVFHHRRFANDHGSGVIEHDSNTSLAEELLLKVAKNHTKVLNHPAPSVMFKKVGDQGLEFDLRLFIPHIDHFVSVKHEIHNAINTAFREGGIRFFTFSHRDIDVRSIAGDVLSGFPVQGIE